MELTPTLLSLTAALAPDGGDGVVRVLREILREAAPFDEGEVAVAQPIGFERWTLTEDQSPLVADDLLCHVADLGRPLRIDDLPELAGFARSREMLAKRGLRSLLGLPLSVAGGARGALVLASRQGWGFVGASLLRLSPVGGMTGLALDRARSLTRLHKQADALGQRRSGEQDASRSPGAGPRSPEDEAKHAGIEEALAAARKDLEVREGEAKVLRAELESTRVARDLAVAGSGRAAQGRDAVVVEPDAGRGEAEVLRAQLDMLRAEHDIVLAERARVGAVTGERDTAREERDRILGERDAAYRDRDHAQGALAALRGDSEGAVAQVVQERDEARGHAHRIGEELQGARNDLAAAHHENANLRGGLEGLTFERDEARGRAESAHRELGETRGVFEATLQERDHARGELEAARRYLEAERRAREAVGRERDDLAVALEVLRHEHEGQDVALTAAQAEAASLREDVQRASGERGSVRRDLEALRAAADAAEVRARSLEERLAAGPSQPEAPRPDAERPGDEAGSPPSEPSTSAPLPDHAARGPGQAAGSAPPSKGRGRRSPKREIPGGSPGTTRPRKGDSS